MLNAACPSIGVRILSDFWTPDQCAEYVCSVEKSSNWQAAAMGRYQDDVVVDSYVDQSLRDVDVLNLSSADLPNPLLLNPELLPTINSELGCHAQRISRSMVSRYTFGSHIKPHKDTGSYNTSRLATIVLYLNSSFEGGNLIFPDLSVEISPRTGDLVFFYSEFRHAVSVVTAGVRYCIVGFAESDSVFEKVVAH